jgi:hypothetical protein
VAEMEFSNNKKNSCYTYMENKWQRWNSKITRKIAVIHGE